MALQDAAQELLGLLFKVGQSNVDSANSGTAVTVTDSAVASTSVITLNGVTPVITLPSPGVAGKRKRLYLVQDATGSRVASWVATGGTIKWVGAAAPTLSTAAGKIDRIDFESIDGVNWIGHATLNIS